MPFSVPPRLPSLSPSRQPPGMPRTAPGTWGWHSPSELPHGSGVGPSPAAGTWVPPHGSTGGPAGAAGLQGSPEAGVGAGPPQGSAVGGTGGPPQGSEAGVAVGMEAAMGAGPPQGSEAVGGAGAGKTSARSMREDCRERVRGEQGIEDRGAERGTWPTPGPPAQSLLHPLPLPTTAPEQMKTVAKDAPALQEAALITAPQVGWGTPVTSRTPGPRPWHRLITARSRLPRAAHAPPTHSHILLHSGCTSWPEPVSVDVEVTPPTLLRMKGAV